MISFVVVNNLTRQTSVLEWIDRIMGLVDGTGSWRIPFRTMPGVP